MGFQNLNQFFCKVSHAFWIQANDMTMFVTCGSQQIAPILAFNV